MTIRFPTFARARDVARASDAGGDGTTRSGKISRARMRRAARASDRTRVVEAVETPIPRMCLANADDDDAETTTRRRAMDGSIDDARTARRERFRPRRASRASLRFGLGRAMRRLDVVFDRCRVAKISKIIHERDSSRASSHTSARGRPARGRRRARGRPAAHCRLRRLRRVSRVSRARENDDERRPP